MHHYSATGTLDMHGVTRTVSFTVSARIGGQIDVLADVTIPFSEWGISNPSIGGFVLRRTAAGWWSSCISRRSGKCYLVRVGLE